MFLSLALIAVALISFFGVLGSTNPQDTRQAITISVVTVFFILVSLVAFFSLVSKKDNLEFRPISQAMITSFTAIVGIVIPSYFAASAYIHVNAQRTPREAPEGERDELRQGQEPPSEQAGASATATEEADKEEPHSATGGAQEPAWRRWRRWWFGG